jgi:flagellar motor switch/type III secretory pathway protein FliN
VTRVDSFPWTEVPSARSLEGDLVRATQAAKQAFRLEDLGAVVQELLAATLSGSGVSRQRAEAQPQAPALAALVITREVELLVSPEPELIAFALTRLLGRPYRLNEVTPTPSQALLGAWHALVFELARRLSRGEPPTLSLGDATASAPAHVVDTWLRLDDRSFRVEVAVRGRDLPERIASQDVPLRFTLVAGTFVVTGPDLSGLGAEDVVLPGAGWFSPHDVGRTLIAIPADAESGIRLQVSDVLRYVGAAHLPHDCEASALEDATKESLIAELPIVIRVEVGSVTMSIREWMGLGPGDVLSCGVPPRSPVVLRTAGREVARGELVTVDGEIGVRITEIVVGEQHDTRPGEAPPEES